MSALTRKYLSKWGELLTQSHNSQRVLVEASGPAIDALVDDALLLGAKGARLTGGGFGGCMLVVLEKKNYEHIVEKLFERHKNAWLVALQ